MVTLLMDQGANLSYQNEHGNTALHEAALNGHHSVVKKIVSGKDKEDIIKKVNNAGETPLIVAAKYGKLEVMLLILEVHHWGHYTNDLKAINGKNALDYSIIKFGHGHPVIRAFDCSGCVRRAGNGELQVVENNMHSSGYVTVYASYDC
jgi:hypothetical protein